MGDRSTTELKARIASVLEPRLKRAADEAGPHPDVDQLVRYHGGELGDAIFFAAHRQLHGQLGTEPPSSHAWIMGFAIAPDGRQVAVAVLVEGQPGVSEQTGGRVAAPIARAIMEAALAAPEPVAEAPEGGE